jgi:hypothetical protein
VKKAALLILAVLAGPALAEAPKEAKKGLNENWAGLWDDCYDLNLPYFQSRIKKFKEFLKAGDGWELAIELEKIKIEKFNKETCHGYGLARNDSDSILKMTAEMGKTAQDANDLMARGDTDIGKQLKAWMEVEQKELDEYGFKLKEFPCGQAMERTKKVIIARMKEIGEKAKTIAVECPKTMEAAVKDPNAPRGPKVGVSQTYGKGSGAPVPVGNPQNGASDISGIKKAQDQEAMSEEKLRQQDEEARKRNQKKSGGK